jgi:hypothetical protein
MEAKIDVELKELRATLANIEEARPFDQLTVRRKILASPLVNQVLRQISQVTDVGEAHPRIVEVVETMMKKGKWSVPGQYPCWHDTCLGNILMCPYFRRVQGEVRRSQPHLSYYSLYQPLELPRPSRRAEVLAACG